MFESKDMAHQWKVVHTLEKQGFKKVLVGWCWDEMQKYFSRFIEVQFIGLSFVVSDDILAIHSIIHK